MKRLLLLIVSVLAALPALAQDGCPDLKIVKELNAAVLYYGTSAVAVGVDRSDDSGFVLYEYDHRFQETGQLLQAATSARPGENARLHILQAYWDSTTNDYQRGVVNGDQYTLFDDQFSFIRFRTHDGVDAFLAHNYTRKTLFVGELIYDELGVIKTVDGGCAFDDNEEAIFDLADGVIDYYQPGTTDGARIQEVIDQCANNSILLHRYYQECVDTGPVNTLITSKIPPFEETETPKTEDPKAETPNGGEDVANPSGSGDTRVERPKRRRKGHRKRRKKRGRKTRKRR